MKNQLFLFLSVALGILVLDACTLQEPDRVWYGPGYTDGPRETAAFNLPTGIAVDASGVLYVADTGNNLIRKIAGGFVSTLAGGGAPGQTKAGHADGVGTAATFSSPLNVAVTAEGIVYVIDGGNNLVRKITPEGVVTTLAGGGSPGGTKAGHLDGWGSAAKFRFGADVHGIVIDSTGTLIVADSGNNLLRKISAAGEVTSFVGGGYPGGIDYGFQDGTGSDATFHGPSGLSIDSDNNLFVADTENRRIRKVTADGAVTTLAGGGPGYDTDGVGTDASLNLPYGLTIDSVGNLYVVDRLIVRKVTPSGQVSFLAGGAFETGNDGQGAQASFLMPEGIVFSTDGNLYVADTQENVIRKVSSDGTVSLFAGRL